jgi:GntR family histidine utilization transcriptional repressor
MNVRAKPRYQQLKELIIGRISSGELQPRDRVPSEHELVDSTGVSRMTANRALRELNDEGYVDRIAGRGTFVADIKAASHVLEVRNIADEIRMRGHQHSSNVLIQESLNTTADIADLLQTNDGENVFHVLLVHLENEVPIQVEERYTTRDFAGDFLRQDFRCITPSAYLSGIAVLQEAQHVVRAVMPTQETSAHLQMNANEPCLLVIRRTWARGVPVSFARLYHPGSRFEMTGHYAPPGTQTTTASNVEDLRKMR